MMHLYDRLLHSPTHLSPIGREALKQSPLFLIDNVADYVDTHYQEGLNPLADTPILAPPFQRYFMEYRFPEALWTRMSEARDFNPSRYSLTHLLERGPHAIPDAQPLTRVGIWFEAELLTDSPQHTEHTIAQYLFKTIIRLDLERQGWEPTRESTRRLIHVDCMSRRITERWGWDLIQGKTSHDEALHACQQIVATLDNDTRATILHRLSTEQIRAAIISNRLPIGLTDHLLPQRAKWKVTARIFFEWMHHHRIHTQQMDNIRYCVSPTGQIPTDDQGQYYFYTFAPSLIELQDAGGSTHGIDPYAGAAKEELFIAFLATSFLHCKNVTTTPHTPIRQPRPKQHKHARVSEAPSTYHVLNIQPVQRLLTEEGDIEHTGIRHALHICRGHFKDYRTHGLFGKNQGVYWWQHQVRGNAKKGQIHTEYHVTPPRTDPASSPTITS